MTTTANNNRHHHDNDHCDATWAARRLEQANFGLFSRGFARPKHGEKQFSAVRIRSRPVGERRRPAEEESRALVTRALIAGGR
jgi:hypothetical protein